VLDKIGFVLAAEAMVPSLGVEIGVSSYPRPSERDHSEKNGESAIWLGLRSYS